MSEEPLQLFALYPFETDAAYKKGLESILTGNADALSERELELRARVFYFNRLTGHTITIEQAKQVMLGLSKGAPFGNDNAFADMPPPPCQLPDHSEEEPRILTFAEIQELISSGRMDKIPNNKIIPDELNDATPSTSVATIKKKPWEHVIPEEGAESDLQVVKSY